MLSKNEKLNLPKGTVSMSRSRTEKVEKVSQSMTCLEDLPFEKPTYSKETLRKGLGEESYKQINQQTSGTMSFGYNVNGHVKGKT